jgi:hypothetical protein
LRQSQPQKSILLCGVEVHFQRATSFDELVRLCGFVLRFALFCAGKFILRASKAGQLFLLYTDASAIIGFLNKIGANQT